MRTSVCKRCRLLLLFAAAITLSSGASLPEVEVNALRAIGKSLGKNDWNFSADPCGGKFGWADVVNDKEFLNAVTCNCSITNITGCHVVSIVLKSQNLSGTLPKDVSGLPYLQEFDVSRNYLRGTIPSEWGKSKLVQISLLGNRLTGSIPKEFGNVKTLVNLTVEFNQLSGVLPPELGNLPLLEKLFLSSNNFNGSLPASFKNLTSMKDFRIVDTNFAGPIPELIENWANLEKLLIQGSGFSAPIPSGISRLVNLEEIRISDLENGTDSPFPLLSGMQNLKRLILRNCRITGNLPGYLADMTGFKMIDLSFNKLTGVIPDSYENLRKTQYIYLTGNKLTGEVPSWMINRGENIDVSYNNFTFQGSCQEKNVNIFSGSSSNTKPVRSCSPPCSKDYYGFHVNAGGKSSIFEGEKFEADEDQAGPAKFFSSVGSNWGFSNTGHFMDDDETIDIFIVSNTTDSSSPSTIYNTARLSPLSLTYIGYCLKNGDYKVDLHFAEIQFSDDETYASLGQRVFDVYIQGKMVLREFNIAKEAGGALKPLVKHFDASVVDNSLEIRLYWAGKGTTALPRRGTYGPLVSAISVASVSKPPSVSDSKTVGIVIVVVIAAAVLAVIFVVVILRRKGCICRDEFSELRGMDLQTCTFSLKQIKTATNNFAPENKIGEGGFGPVYKGLLSDGTVIAVKKLSALSKQGNREFVNEIGMISALRHPHLVKLYGCCIDGQQLHLVYEYMENNSLARALFGADDEQVHLDWPTRRKICIGIARGLAFLHEESVLKIVHRDIKATNVLLDKHLNPKISDFGLAKLDDEANTHISTRIAGTYGYMSPEYAMRGHLTDKADVYSFGVVALEIVSGRSNSSYGAKPDAAYLLDVAISLKEQGKLLELVDRRLGTEYGVDEALDMINIALLCTCVDPGDRPPMSSVVSMLEGNAAVAEVERDGRETASAAARRQHYDLLSEYETESETRSMAVDGPWTGSSVSAPDLNPGSWNSLHTSS